MIVLVYMLMHKRQDMVNMILFLIVIPGTLDPLSYFVHPPRILTLVPSYRLNIQKTWYECLLEPRWLFQGQRILGLYGEDESGAIR